MAMLVGKVNAAYEVQMKKWVCPCSCGLVLTTHGRSINRNGQVRCLCPFSTPTLHGLTVCVDRIAQCGRAFKTKDDLLQHWNVLEETCTISKISHATLVCGVTSDQRGHAWRVGSRLTKGVTLGEWSHG